jgi:hypothetical protein
MTSIFMKVGAMDGAMETSPPYLTIPMGMPRMAVMSIPHRIAPRTFLIMRTPVITSPARERIVGRLRMSPSITNVDGWATTSPASMSPTKAMSSPMPQTVPYLIDSGIASMSACRTLVNVRRVKIKPSTNTHPRATCQGIRMVMHTV